MRASRSVLTFLTAAAVVGTLVACAPTAEVSTLPATVDEPVVEAPADEAPADNGDTAEFANPVTEPGELLTTITGEGFSVAVYQVGTEKASKTGQFATPDGKPVIEVGADIVFVNYVVTNTGTADIPLGYSLVDISARYEDWPYLQGMDSVVDSALFESLQVNSSALAAGAGDAPFVWKPGTSFSYGQNFLYQAGSPIVFSVSLTPVDAAGDLLHDEGQDIDGATSIK